ncbi:MAG: hypothetical protein ACRDPI_00730 [Nocardioidaceae bacterium]
MDALEILGGRTSYCPDCAAERLVAHVSGPEFCCTTCDAALLIVDAVVDAVVDAGIDAGIDAACTPGTAA